MEPIDVTFKLLVSDCKRRIVLLARANDEAKSAL